MTNDNSQPYHYIECGLDNIWLENGFDIDNDGMISIKNIKELHETIGIYLVFHKERLHGKDIRYLRTEMLLSQEKLARLLLVGAQTVLRWETGKSEINKQAEALLRILYAEHLGLGKDSSIKNKLKEIDLIEEEIDCMERNKSLHYNPEKQKWEEPRYMAA